MGGSRLKKIVFSYAALMSLLADTGVPLSKLALYTGISVKMLRKKLDEGLPFKMRHVKSICTRLHIQEEDIRRYFFVEKFDHTEQQETGAAR